MCRSMISSPEHPPLAALHHYWATLFRDRLASIQMVEKAPAIFAALHHSFVIQIAIGWLCFLIKNVFSPGRNERGAHPRN